MYKCRYCSTAFEQLPIEHGVAVSSCPKCGGPNPEQVQPEVKVKVVSEYVYVPTQSYYVPPRNPNPVGATRTWAYSTFGYRAVTAAVVLLIVSAVAASFVYWLFVYRTPVPPTTDESYQLTLPTAVPTATQVADENPWKEEVWLTADEARELRSKGNVVNLAYLDKGGALYSAKHSFMFVTANPWEQAKPLGITELTLSGTSVQLKAGGYIYTLNVYQPFVLASQSEKVVIVDAQGNVWQADLASLAVVTIDTVVSGLPFEIAPNPNLSFTY